MASPSTCGEGIAENAALPAAVAGVLDAIAENLEAHLAALDPGGDDAAAAEHAAWTAIAARHRALAADLRAAADEMAAQRDLPMAPHDEAAMASPEALGAFEALVGAEAQLSALLARRAREWEAMR
jgi:hypothetical protein